MTLRRVLVQVVATLAVAAAWTLVPTTSAHAATCATSSGVSVIVDFHELGGGIQGTCVSGGGGDTAASLFPSAGFPLTYVTRQPGMVCRVSGKPADSPCVNSPPATAYWSLWWSDGKSGTWTYSSYGVGGLKVPDGGYVAFSWQGSSSRTTPGVSPAPHASATPTPSASPTAKPTKNPGSTHSPGSHPPATNGSSGSSGSAGPSAGSTSGTTGPSAGATTAPSASASEQAGEEKTRGQKARGQKARGQKTRGDKAKQGKPGSASAAPSEPAGDSAVGDVAPASSEATEPDGGLPGWVAPAIVVLLFGAAGGVALVRRRRGSA